MVEVGKQYKILGFHKDDAYHEIKGEPTGCTVLITNKYGFEPEEKMPGFWAFDAVVVKGNLHYTPGRKLLTYACQVIPAE